MEPLPSHLSVNNRPRVLLRLLASNPNSKTKFSARDRLAQAQVSVKTWPILTKALVKVLAGQLKVSVLDRSVVETKFYSDRPLRQDLECPIWANKCPLSKMVLKEFVRALRTHSFSLEAHSLADSIQTEVKDRRANLY